MEEKTAKSTGDIQLELLSKHVYTGLQIKDKLI